MASRAAIGWISLICSTAVVSATLVAIGPAGASPSKPAAGASSAPTSTPTSHPKRTQDKELRINTGFAAGQATFTLHGKAKTTYTVKLSGQGSVRPTVTGRTVTTDATGVATASVPVSLTADRTGGVVADISSTVAGEQRVTSSSIWLRPNKKGAIVTGASAVATQLQVITSDAADPAAATAAVARLATAPAVEQSTAVAVSPAVASNRIQVHGTARWTDWNGNTHPARHIEVGFSTNPLAPVYGGQVETDDNGNYTYDVPAVDPNTEIQVYFFAQNAGAQVGRDGLGSFSGFGAYYRIVNLDHLNPGDSVTANLTAGRNGPFDVSFAIADALWTAYSFGKDLTGSGAESIMVDYPEQINGNDTGAYTNPGLRRMTIADREWSAWDIMNHEYGHWFDSKHDISDLPGGTHCIDDNLATSICGGSGLGKDTGTKLAWSEGFADFYSISASHYGPLPSNMPSDVGDGFYDDDQVPSTGGTVGGFNANSDLAEPYRYNGEDNEFSIAGALFNLEYAGTTGSVFAEHTGIGPYLLMNNIISAHAHRFADVVNQLWPSDNTSTLLTSEENDFSCLLSAAQIAPYWGSAGDPMSTSTLSASLSNPPAIIWQAGNSGNFTNNNFVVQAIDSTGLPYFTSSGLTGTTWTPSRGDWDAMTRGHGGSISIRVLGANTADPYTGVYRGCLRQITLTSTAVSNAAQCTAVTLPPNDDGSTGAVDLPFPVNFYGTTYTYLYVNNNGNVTFNAPLGTYTPFTITASTPPIIAPFFADVDTRGTGSAPVTYSYGTTTFNGHQAFCVNWLNVGYFGSHTDKLNSFQLMLVDRQDRGAGDFDIVFNYDSIQWETGDASGGVGGFGGTPAGVGFSAGTGDAGQFFQLPGSLQTHQFTDGDPKALASGNIGALSNPGRYIFAVSNGQAPNSTTGVRGTVSAGGFPVADAPVQVCPHGGGHCVYQTRTGSDGQYSAVGIPAGTYDVKAFPPPGLTADPGTVSSVTVDEGRTVQVDVTLHTMAGPPPGTTIGPLVGSNTGVPVVNWNDRLNLATTGCPGGTASYEIFSLESGSLGESFGSGSVPEVSPGHYATTIAPVYPHHGYAEVDIFITCQPGTADETVTFDIYIDPSGTVVDQTGAPIEGATVTLLRSDAADGPFTAVPNGSDLMSPANRNNPMVTDTTGRFGWDVVGGFYQITASKSGCHAGNGSASVTSAVYDVPPAVTGLVLSLVCPVVDTTPPIISASPLSLEGNTTGGYTGTLSGVTASDPGHPADAVTLTNNAPAVLPLGVTTVTWTATDLSGNHASVDQQVTVIDTTAPTISCPAAVSGSYPSTPVLGTATATDIVDSAPVITNNAPASFPAGSTTVTWTARDHSGNAATCQQQVTLTAPVAAAIDTKVSADGGTGGKLTTAAFNTTAGNDTLLAIVGSDGPSSGKQTVTVTGAGLTWTLVERANAVSGDSEVWRAVATTPLTGVKVTTTQATTGYHQSITVLAIKGGAVTVGAHTHGSATTGAPKLTLTPTKSGSLVFTGGEDWTSATARTLVAGQSMVHEYRDTSTHDDYWISQATGTTRAGTAMTTGASAPTKDRWNLVAIEIG